MTTAITPTAQADPLAPRLLPGVGALSHSTAAPSTGATRPFGLTCTTPLAGNAAAASLDGLTYDPQRQVNVHHDGAPLSRDDLMLHAGTSQNTQADHQWWTDKDQ
ncbi:putative ATP-grasp-modified RiPP [Streptomyces sp. NPDC006784]|uniref:putative ATP-grasp-modified RiPP n=1 Tax=Streptomyces sp. NPDC006784 TaxID=3364764 RepID=UPI0036AD4869